MRQKESVEANELFSNQFPIVHYQLVMDRRSPLYR
jgi:hypothetical protein